VKILLIGSGSKEHAIIWKLLSSEKYQDWEIIVAPGNLALGRIAECLDVDINDIDKLLEIAIARNVNLTIVGESRLYSQGIVDRFREANKLILGPTQAASRLESSNCFAKDLMYRNNISCPRFVSFDNLNMALAFINSVKFPLKIRLDRRFDMADSMIIATDFKEARKVLKEMFKQKFLARDVISVVLEECVEGHEFTINTICDGQRALMLPPVQSYRNYNDTADGYYDLGAYAPTPILTDNLMRRIRHEIINPTIEAMKISGNELYDGSYTGLLAFDLVLDVNDALKPKLIQYRTTMADSDAQVILPLFDEDLYEVLSSSANADLSFYKDGFHKFLGSALAVNIVAGDSYAGLPGHIYNLDILEKVSERLEEKYGSLNGVPLVFYGLTGKRDKDSRGVESEVFGATAVAENLLDAQILAYKLADTISVPSKCYERNIGDQGMV
jgi:phosphoribosylamine--glycine ligase